MNVIVKLPEHGVEPYRQQNKGRRMAHTIPDTNGPVLRYALGSMVATANGPDGAVFNAGLRLLLTDTGLGMESIQAKLMQRVPGHQADLLSLLNGDTPWHSKVLSPLCNIIGWHPKYMADELGVPLVLPNRLRAGASGPPDAFEWLLVYAEMHRHGFCQKLRALFDAHQLAMMAFGRMLANAHEIYGPSHVYLTMRGRSKWNSRKMMLLLQFLPLPMHHLVDYLLEDA